MNSAVGKFFRFAVEGLATDDAKAERANLWDSLSPDEQKQTIESRVFVSFASSTSLLIDPFRHINEIPPLPDIRVSIDGRDRFFELGEITDHRLAESMAASRKTGVAAGCSVSLVDPHINILKKKCSKTYPTNGTPVDLLLYYWRHPDDSAMHDHLLENHQDVEELYRNSQFDRIWIYDWQARKVLWKLGE